MPVYEGGCHCGALTLRYTTTSEPTAVQPRACDCSYCTRQGAMYVSDPAGSLSVTGERQVYRQGEERAEFLSCGHCGVLIAVVYEDRGAVNVRCLERFGEFAQPVGVSPQKLSAEEKVARWRANWTPLA